MLCENLYVQLYEVNFVLFDTHFETNVWFSYL